MTDWLPLVGVVVAQFVLVGLYFARQRSEDNRRWHEKRLDAYRALARTARDASVVFAQAGEPHDLDDQRLVEACDAADACMLDIDLLASNPVRDAATMVHTTLEMCVVFDPPDEAFPTAEMLIEVRADFENAVRRELGIDRTATFSVEAESRSELATRAFRVVLGFPLAPKVALSIRPIDGDPKDAKRP